MEIRKTVKESVMFKDRKFLWVLEYIIGIAFLAATMPFIVHPQQGWSEAHSWAYLLFIACSGIVLLCSASAMRRRIGLEKRIEKLESQIEELKHPGHNSSNSRNIQKLTAEENFIGSLN